MSAGDEDVRWLAESHIDGELSARVGRRGDQLVAEWPDQARLTVKRDGTDARFVPDPTADPTEVEKLRRGAVRLLLTHLAGGIPLHASAVAVDGAAVVFVGGAGHGKSTLAAAFCEILGASLLGDDAVTIERSGDGYDVVALEENHWLDAAAARALGRPDDVGEEKVPLPTRRADVARAPLVMIAHLVFDAPGERSESEGARLVPVLGLDAVSGLLAQLTRFVFDDPEIARRDLRSLAGLVDRTAIVRLERPRRLDLLRETAELVAGDLARIAGRAR